MGGKLYKQDDLKNLPDGTYIFMLNMKGDIINSMLKNQTKFSYRGKVNVTRADTYTFKFTMDGIRHELSNGSLYIKDDKLSFLFTNPWAAIFILEL